MTTLFISDLHLEAARPEIAGQFLNFLESEAVHAEALYILGDLFESWVGDDDPNTHYKWIKQALRKLSNQRVPIYFMHGNRDFMIGDQFADETGIKLLPDPTGISLYGTSVLLSHGDAYCTDDVKYQEVRAMTRNPEWQTMMLSKTLEERLHFAESARVASLAHGQAIDLSISDVNPAAIENVFAETKVDVLLHGHTHRPAIHELIVDNKPVTRIVLGDWYSQGSVLRWDDTGPDLRQLER